MANNNSVLFDHDDVHLKAAIPADVLKSVLIIALLAITLISSLIPFALRRAAINQNVSAGRRHLFISVFSLLSCFGGGVFLATCLLDLLPDTRELIGDGLEQLRIKSSFPLSEFLVAIGFFLVLFIEQIVLWFRERRGKIERHDHGVSNDEDQRRLISDGAAEVSRSSPAERIIERRRTDPSTRRSNENTLGTLATIGNVPRQRHHAKRQKSTNGDGESPEEDSNPPTRGEIGSTNVPLDDSMDSIVHETPQDESIREDVHFDPESHSTFRALMLVVALSCHATFEGLALGLQKNPAMALQIFGALCIHKCVVAFSLGMRLVQSRLSTMSIVGCCLLFCVSATIGGFIGLAITEAVKSSSASLINGSLQGIACGTFLYITAFEILPHELNDGIYRLPKLLMLLLGYTCICLFVLLYPD